MQTSLWPSAERAPQALHTTIVFELTAESALQTSEPTFLAVIAEVEADRLAGRLAGRLADQLVDQQELVEEDNEEMASVRLPLIAALNTDGAGPLQHIAEDKAEELAEEDK